MLRRLGFRLNSKQLLAAVGFRGQSLGLSVPKEFAACQPSMLPSKHLAGGKLADIADLDNPEFGAEFRRRFPNGTDGLPPRKLWELAWIAQRFEHLNLDGGDWLGLGVGHEPLIFHFAHRARSVLATDLYSAGTAWREARLAADQVFESSPFPFPRERLSVKNMDMRKLELANDSLNGVWSCSSVEHVQTLPQFVQIFREIHRVLRPGGVALITTEFSLGEPYFLPGVLSLWPGCSLFGQSQSHEGLTLLGPVDLRYRDDVPGNLPTLRRDSVRVAARNSARGPAGLCRHIGYTRLIPIALAFQKTGPRFDWPEHLGAPNWYVPLATGIEIFENRKRAAEAGKWFRKALATADSPGARLHCYRALIESHVHAIQVAELGKTLRACEAASADFPADDDALDLIGYVAAGAGHLPFARLCWEKAASSPSALPTSVLRIRLNQIEAELRANGKCGEARRLFPLAVAAHAESVDVLGAGDLLFQQLDRRFQELGARLGGVAPISSQSRRFLASRPRLKAVSRLKWFPLEQPFKSHYTQPMSNRIQNECRDCGFAWLPKGRNDAPSCPKCQSENVDIVEIRKASSGLSQFPVLGCLIAVGFIVGVYFVLTEWPKKQAPPPSEEEQAQEEIARKQPDKPEPKRNQKKDDARIDSKPPVVIKKKEEPPKTVVDPAEAARKQREKNEADAKFRLASIKSLAKVNPDFAIRHANELIKLYPDSPEAAEAREILKGLAK